jgi:hypothetical protein
VPSPQRWEEVYEEVRAQEMAILETLITGAALEEHMEVRECCMVITLVIFTLGLDLLPRSLLNLSVISMMLNADTCRKSCLGIPFLRGDEMNGELWTQLLVDWADPVCRSRVSCSPAVLPRTSTLRP